MKKEKTVEQIKRCIVGYWDISEDKSSIMSLIKDSMKSIKLKMQNGALMLVEILIKNGKIEEMEYLNSIKDNLEKMSQNRNKT